MKISREAKVGIFAVAMLVALYWGVNFLKGKDLFRSTNRYYAMYDQIGGLQPSSSIVVKGFKVGTVSGIYYNPERSEKIVVEMNIKSKYKLPDNSAARIYNDGLMGGKALEIVLGDSPIHLHDKDTLRSEMNKDFLEIANSEFDDVKKKASEVVNELTATLANLNRILDANAGSIETTMNNMASMSTTLDDVLSAEKSDLVAIISNLNALSETLKNNSERIDGILANVHGVTDSLNKADFPRAVENLSGSLEQLNYTLTAVNNAEGSVGKLIHDDSLYNSLTEASVNLSRLLEDVKHEPGKYIHFSLFGGKNKSK